MALGAGGVKGDWEVGFFAGYSILDNYEAGDSDDFRPLLISDDDLNPDDDVFFGLRVGYWFNNRLSLEGSYQMLSTEAEFDRCTAAPCPGTAEQLETHDADLDSFRVNVLYHWREAAKWRPFATLGLGLETTDIKSVMDEDDLGLNAGFGIRWLMSNRLSLRMETRYVLADVGGPVDETQYNLEAGVGLSFSFGGSSPVDSDGDGVTDRKDDCPLTPRGAFVDEKGCPEDADGDGVADGLDRCPDTPAGTRVDGSGCATDTDGDGVLDPDDECPDTPRGAEVGATGCPRDSDGDGILDGLDACPNTPLGARVDERGCPKDDDRDGVYNGLDRCPNSPGSVVVDARGCMMDEDRDGIHDGLDQCPGTPRETQVDRNGCPLAPVVTEEPLVLEGVNFEPDSAELTRESYPILDRVAASLQGRRGMRIEIAGHTDSQGSEDHNQDLSRRRAESVRDFLRSRGVDDSILVARGYGESQPIADNGTAEGRAQNRRVTLKKLD
jgi:outer membrane protein OmpA-like peptidoglycan-associated protein